MSDFLDDLNRRIITSLVKLGNSENSAAIVAAELVMDLRRDWAGERPFIGRYPPRDWHGERNRAIIRAVKDGKSLGQVAREHKISRERVRQIVQG